MNTCKFFTPIIATILASTMPLAITACNPGANDSNVLNMISSPTPVPLSVKKGYYVAMQAAVGLEHTADIAVDSKLITPGSPTAIKVADGLDKLHTVMTAANTALKAGDAATLSQKIQEVENLVAQVAPLLPNAQAAE